jgi:hypothetical protein
MMQVPIRQFIVNAQPEQKSYGNCGVDRDPGYPHTRAPEV